MRRKRLVRAVAFLGILALAATACGGDEQGPEQPQVIGTKGGVLRLIAAGDVDFIDPGQNYYTFGYGLFRVVLRNLMAYPPLPGAEGLVPVPDGAAGPPEISADKTTFTFKIRQGIRFGPPVNRQVTSRDYKYGIERAFLPNVGGSYLKYLNGQIGPALVGAAEMESGKAKEISGITTPDDQTIVFTLAAQRTDFVSLIAGLPQYAPVPVEYAKPHDAKNPSTYGEHQVSSGPYMFKNEPDGNIKGAGLGWDPGKKIILVRNPNWDEKNDPIRKAFPDSIEVHEGFEDSAIGVDKIQRGEFDINWDFPVPPEKLQGILASATLKPRLNAESQPCIRYVFLNVTIPPFDNVHVRRAVAYVLNKDAMRKTRGGATAGEIATQAILPGLAGFEEAGGKGFNPYPSPNFQGDLEKALDEMKAAKADGVANIGDDGKYTGRAVLIVGANVPVPSKTTAQVGADLAKIGIRTTIREFDPNVVFTNWYEIPAKNIAIGSNSAWCYDFPSPASFLAPLVIGPGAGKEFPAVKNVNYGLLNDPELNRLIAQASAETDAGKQADLYGQINKKTMELVPFVPWLFDAYTFFTSTRVKNYLLYRLAAAPDLAVIAVQ